jgi:two-component system LytT family response regulator
MRRPTDRTSLFSRHPFVDADIADEPPEPQPALRPEGACLTRIPVRAVNRIVIVQVAEIRRLEAEDNYVRIWTDRPYLHKETLTRLVDRLDPRDFLRIHRSHAVNLRVVRELRPQIHGEYIVVLDDGTELTSGRSYRGRIQQAFGLARAQPEQAVTRQSP